MSNVYLGWPNRMDEATVSGGDWLTALPLAHLLDRTPTVIARSTDCEAVSTQFDLTLPAARSLRAFALVNHNLSTSAMFRVSLGSTLGGSEVLSSGWQPVWRINFDTDLLEWESDGWWDGDYDDDFVGHPFAALYLAPATVSARYVRIEIADADNPDGYIQLGRVFLGGGISPVYGITYGMSDQWEDTSTAEAALGGSEYFDVRRRCRVARFELPYLHQDSEFRQFHEMQRRLGTTGELLYLPDTQNLSESQLTGFVGRMRQLSAIEYPYYKARKLGFEVKEIL